MFPMSASNPPPASPDESIPDGWSDLTPEERAELDADFAQAEENIRNGVPGIPIDEVLPRYRQTG